MILVIDNYDSFTYNLVHYFQILDQEVIVFRNDEIAIDTIKKIKPNYIVISPGPKGPEEAGISLDVIDCFYRDLPILGICLGHQCLAHYFGGTIIQAPTIVHGKTSLITHNKLRLFRHLPSPFVATRYHSLCVDESTLPSCFSIDAFTDEGPIERSNRPLFKLASVREVRGDMEHRTGMYTQVHEDSSTVSTTQFSSEVAFKKRSNVIMAISHRQYPLFGLQFHPESILTEHGLTLLKQFLDYEHFSFT